MIDIEFLHCTEFCKCKNTAKVPVNWFFTKLTDIFIVMLILLSLSSQINLLKVLIEGQVYDVGVRWCSISLFIGQFIQVLEYCIIHYSSIIKFNMNYSYRLPPLLTWQAFTLQRD